MNPAHYKKILIIATRQIGDTLITTPLIERAHAIWPKAKIDFLGFDHTVTILQGNPFLHEIIGTPKKPRFLELLKIVKKIFFRYDLAIITQPSDRAYIYGFFSSQQRVGVCHPGKENRGWKKWLTQYQVPIDYFKQHVVIEKLQLLNPFNYLLEHTPPIVVTPPRQGSLPIELQDRSVPYVVMHPSPLNDYKCWPVASWVKLIEYFAQRHILVVLSGGPDRKDELLAKAILLGLSPSAQHIVLNMTQQLSFATLAQVLHHAQAYVGVDTAITHLAAACEIPTIALFGATPPTNYGPWPNGTQLLQPFQLRASSQTVGQVTILQGPGDCVPCRRAGCDDTANSRSLCLEELPVTQVIQAYENALRKSIPIQRI